MQATIVPKNVIMEVNLISAQELPYARKPNSSLSNIQTYVVAYLDPNQKLRSRTDKTGDVNPTWNDKFIVVLDEHVLSGRPNSCLVFEIYSTRRFKKDKLIGVVHVLLQNLIKKDTDCCDIGVPRKFNAFHVRDGHGEPHGVLNLGFAIATGTLNEMFQDHIPKFLSSDSAANHRKLMSSPYSLATVLLTPLRNSFNFLVKKWNS